MNHSLWQKSFGALQVFSMMAGLYQALAANQILGAMTSNPIHFGLLTFSASIFAVIGYLTSGFLIDKIGVIKIFIFAQISLFFANMILFGFVFTSPSVYGWIIVVSSSFFFISFEALSRGQVIIEFFHKVDSGPVGVRAVSFDLLIINVAKLFGFGLGSLALTFFDPKWALLTNALSYLVVYAWISKQKHYFTSPPPHFDNFKTNIKKFVFSYVDTFAHLKTQLKVKIIILNEMVFAALLFCINSQALLFSKQINFPIHWGFLLLGYSVGSILFNTTINKDKLRFVSVVKYSPIVIILGLFMLISENYYLVVLGLILIGGAFNTILVSGRGKIHNLIAHNYKGKIFSLVQISYSVATAIGTMLFAVLIYKYNFQFGFASILAALIVYLLIFRVFLAKHF